MKDGSIAYELKDLEHYEVAVCKDPAVPLALITDYNPIAKAVAEGEELPNGKMKIGCDKFGCYVKRPDLKKKGEDFSNADLTTATASQDIDSGGMGKIGKPTKLDGGLPDLKAPKIKNDPIGNSAGTGTRGLGDFESANQKSPEDQTAQVTSTTEKIKVVGALLAGAGRVLGSVASGAVKDTVNDATTEPEIADKSGYETNQHNIKLGEESIPKKPNEEIV